MQQRILYFDKTLGASKGVHLGHKKQLTDVNQKKSYVLRIYYLFEICLRKIITKNYPVKIQNCIHKTKKIY